jgi:hypothetical protein
MNYWGKIRMLYSFLVSLHSSRKSVMIPVMLRRVTFIKLYFFVRSISDKSLDDGSSSKITRLPLLMTMICQEFLIDFAAKQLIKKTNSFNRTVFIRVYLSENGNKIGSVRSRKQLVRVCG